MTMDSSSGGSGSGAPAGGGAATAAAPTAASDARFFGHPRGLATLFFTELWERLSYYGMRGILILFMTAPVAAGGLGFDTMKAGAIYGLYTSLVYMTALPGGWVADRLVGQRRAVFWGGVIITLGHFSMAFEGLTTFYLGLLLIALGTGLLKPNISAMVGDLYDDGARRDAGFSIFYMGINIGAVLAPLVVGSLGEKVNWHLGFAAAGIGMVAGLIQYAAGGKYLGDAGRLPEAASSPAAQSRSWRMFFGGIAAVFAIAAVLAWLHVGGTVEITFVGMARSASVVVLALVALFFVFTLAAGDLGPTEKKRVGAVAVLFIFSMIFWSGFEQAGSSLNLVAERLTDRVIAGWEMPASWLQGINPLFIILLAPVFAWLWVSLSRRGREPSSPMKFAIGLVLLGIGFLVMVAASARAATGVQVSPMWLIVTYLFHTTGELALSPVGLSTVTKLAPQRLAGQMMGIWFMSISLGNLVAGQVAGFYEALPLPQLFGIVFLTAAGAGLLLALFSRPIRRLMSGVH